MQCSEISECMSLDLDRLLGQEQAARMQAHLAQCEACHEEWEAMRSLSSLLRAEPMATPAPDFTGRVAQLLRQRQARRRRLYSSLGVLMGSVGLWAVVGVALSLVLIILNSGFIGAAVPLALKRLNIDPALATGPFVTTTNDILSLLIYLGLVTFFLRMTA